MTELATEVRVSEVIQREKWAASMIPMRAIMMKLFFGMDLISCRRFLFIMINGRIMSVVKRSR